MLTSQHLRGITLPLLLATLASLSACCQLPKPIDRGPLPPPISLSDQVGRLNRRAQALSALKATGRVKVDYVEDGEKHHEETDASLMLRQIFGPQPAPPNPGQADIVLFGRFMGDDVFEVGQNRQWYWMALKKFGKRAYVGQIGGPAQASESQGGGMPFRADRVLPLLAITPLPSIYPFASHTQTLMLIDNDPGDNHLLLVQTDPGDHDESRVRQPAWIQRELLVDRRTGNVTEVRIYKSDGTIEAVAHLDQYQLLDEPTPRGTPAPPNSATVKMPRKITIEYPTRQAKVELDFSSVRLAPNLLQPTADPTFTLPDFKDQGLQVIDIDHQQNPSAPNPSEPRP